MKFLFFTAPYCTPCALIKDGVKRNIQEAGHTYIEVDVSVTAGRDRAALYGVIGTPALVALDDNDKVVAAYLDGHTQITTNLPELLSNNPSGDGDNTLLYVLGGAALLGLGYLLLKGRKRSRIGIIHPSGKTLCRSRRRSTSKGKGTCSHNSGIQLRNWDAPRTDRLTSSLNGRKKKGVGKIDPNGTTLCRDYKRSTSKSPGACSYHKGVKTYKAELPSYRSAKPNAYRGKNMSLKTRKLKKR